MNEIIINIDDGNNYDFTNIDIKSKQINKLYSDTISKILLNRSLAIKNILCKNNINIDMIHV